MCSEMRFNCVDEATGIHRSLMPSAFGEKAFGKKYSPDFFFTNTCMLSEEIQPYSSFTFISFSRIGIRANSSSRLKIRFSKRDITADIDDLLFMILSFYFNSISS